MTGPGPLRPARVAAARALLFGIIGWLLAGGTAQAQVTTYENLDAPIVRVNIRQGDITVRTWDRNAIAIEGDSSLIVERKSTHQSGDPYPLPVPIVQAVTPEGQTSLPAESFVVSSIPAGQREAVFVRSPVGESVPAPQTPVTITVPNSSVFVFAHTNNGTLDVRDYRGGTLFATAARGRVALTNVGGAVFAQSTHGAIVVTDSSFDRLRARSLTGNVTFERCRARQIEATSVNGSIVYDGGTFEPGLARFESTRGDVAIGATGAAEIGAHAASSGRVFTSFDHTARIDGRDGQTNAIVGGGGPVVNATSQSGNVYLYDGSLHSRGSMSPDWAGPLGTLQRPGERAVRADTAGSAQVQTSPLPRKYAGRGRRKGPR